MNSAAERTQYFLVDSSRNVVYKADSLGQQLSVISAPGIDSHLATIDESGHVIYGLRDGLNSTVMAVDENATVIDTFAYEPFGETTASDNSDYPFLYTGRTQVDDDLFYYRARFYDPKAGRFISEDPIGFGGGDVNLYRYVGNNATNFGDPTGEFLPLVWVVATVLVQNTVRRVAQRAAARVIGHVYTMSVSEKITLGVIIGTATPEGVDIPEITPLISLGVMAATVVPEAVTVVPAAAKAIHKSVTTATTNFLFNRIKNTNVCVNR